MKELIINDLSLTGQFSSDDEFISNLQEIIYIFNECKSFGIELFRKSDFYDCLIMKDKKIIDIMYGCDNPIITKFKSILVNLFSSEPYWDIDSKIDENANYSYTEKYGIINCLHEAAERNVGIVSFKHPDFMFNINLKKNDTEVEIYNINSLYFLEEYMRIREISTYFDYLMQKTNKLNTIILPNNEIPIKEFLESSEVNDKDKITVVEDLIRFDCLYKNGQNLGRLSKKLNGKLFEFRTSLSNSREFRCFYFLKDDFLVLENYFFKKTQKTPTTQINLAYANMQCELLKNN